MSDMRYDVLDVCEYVIAYSDKHDYSISNLKLQKVLYFIQAEFLRIKNEPCFFNEIEAWNFGPVVPTAYSKYLIFGYSGDIHPSDEDPVKVIEDTDQALINMVIDKLADCSATDLVTITQHQTPWLDSYVPHQYNEIKPESIKAYFSEKQSNK
jgi:uncharacterized phage-associated protein